VNGHVWVDHNQSEESFMTSINKILEGMPGEGVELIKEELKRLLKEAELDSSEFARVTAEKLQTWLGLLKAGKIDQREFNALVDDRKRVLKQYLNTLEIQSRTRLRKIVLGLFDIVIEKVVPLIIKIK